MTPVLSHQHALWSQEKDNIWQKKRLRIALSQMAIGLFDFSLSTHTIVQWDNFLAIEPLSQRIETTPEMLVKNGLVHREDAQFFLALFERIEQDETVVSCAIRTKILSANYAWNKITLVAVDNEKGIPYHAVGVVEDITKQKEIELCCGQKEQYWNMMLAEAAVYYEVNVTEDLVETYREKEALGWQEIPKESYHQLLTDIVETRVFAQDKEKYVKTFGIASIMQSFAEGIHELRLEHCWHDKQGQKVWMLTTMHIIRDVLTGNIKGFTYIKNIDEQKQRILALQYQSQRDSLTGLYNRKVTEGLIQDILKRENKPQCHGFLIIDVDDFKQINDTYGHRFGDQILAEIAQKISRLFHQHDVFGRIGGDEFAVFIYNAASPDYVKEKVLAVQQLFLKPFFQKSWPLQISCSMGIAMVGKDGNTFEELYEHADIALYEAKKQGKNCYVFYGSDMKNTLRALHQCAKINWDS